jgi:hypothetical protein
MLSGSSWSVSATSPRSTPTPAHEVTADLSAAADELDALETGLVADVELHPGESATHQVDELVAVADAELGEDAIDVSLHRPH